MNSNNPIIIAEDDPDDIAIFRDVFKSLKIQNEIKFFTNGISLLDYLHTTKDKPFVIIADINLPLMNGIELKEKINENQLLKLKSIPFVFLSTSRDPKVINKAYETIVQGYFQKAVNYNDIKHMIKTIIEYWKLCEHPRT